jgi:O-antigen ligase
MRLLFMLVIGTLATSDTLNMGMSMGHGLSVKNALIYPIALGLMFRMAVTGRFRVRMGVVNAAFLLWIGYALLTWIACIAVIHYPGYQPLRNAITLKGKMFDMALFFFTFFYGAETQDDFLVLIKTLAFAIGMANIMTLADLAGIVHLGITIGTQGVEAGRVFGVFGHANDTGALIVCTLPLLAAIATASRGWAKVFWYLGALASIAVLLLTVSRGAFVGVAIGYAWALWLCRRHLPTERVVAWVLIGLCALIVSAALAAALMPQFIDVWSERLFNQSMATSVAVASSGRTFLWLRTLHSMMAHPITFVTGYGWRTYKLWFVLVTHNYYLDQWFNLGLIGLLAFLTILYQSITTARRAAAIAEAYLRPYLIAFVFGMLGLAVAVFFVNLERPWDYVWIYVGLTLRAAADALENAPSQSARATARVTSDPTGYSPAGRALAAPPRLVGDVRR